MRILIVEDEEALAKDIAASLEKEGYSCKIAYKFEEAREQALMYAYDCILLDLMLPDRNGLALLELLQKEGNEAGVLIISAKGALDDRLKGLDLGADDYLTKPFHLSELNSRVKAIMRRKKFQTSRERVAFSDLELDLDDRSVLVNERSLSLTPKEFLILQHLVANRDRVLSKVTLAEYVWGDLVDEADSFDFLFAHIKNLRKKLEEGGSRTRIESIYGIGYKLTEAPCD